MTRLFSTLLVLLLGVACTPTPTGALTAGSNNKKRNKKSVPSSSTNRGFGAPPPTLEEALSKFRTRVPPDASNLPCPCGIDSTGRRKTYGECCEPLHQGHTTCQTPLQVLQSRYSAFCYRQIGHIITTTHPKCRDFRDDKVAWAKDLNQAGMFDSFDFVGLQVIRQEDDEHDRAKDDGEAHVIEFEVRMRGRENNGRPATTTPSLVGEETVVRERSQFLRDPDTGVWRYSGGDVRSQVPGLEDTILNVS